MQPNAHRILVAAPVCVMLAVACADIVGPDTTPASTPPGADSAATPPASSPDGATTAPSAADTGVLRIATSTLGTDLDPDGYAVHLHRLPDDTARVVPANGRLDVALPAGTYVVSLTGLAPNCSIAPQRWWGTTLQITLPRSSSREPAAQVSFTVQCEAIPVGRLTDGTQLAFVRDGQIWLVNSDGSAPVQLTAGPGDADPAWSPDGRRIAFARQGAIHIMSADGSDVVRLTDRPAARQPTWSADGRDTSDPMRAAMDVYGGLAREVAEEAGAVFIDVQAAFDRVLAHSESIDWAHDRIHPNQPGHAVIALEFLRAFGIEC
jgi:hypothetical protein